MLAILLIDFAGFYDKIPVDFPLFADRISRMVFGKCCL